MRYATTSWWASSIVTTPSGSGLTLRERFAKFGLGLHEEKTRLIEFGRFAAQSREARGLGKPETFEFLGFTHISAKSRAGWFKLQRVTSKKRMRAKLREVKTELMRRRHLPIPEQGQWLRSVVRGHSAYYAVPDNSQAITAFRNGVTRHWRRALRRRGQRGRVNWKRMAASPTIGYPSPGSCIPGQTRASTPEPKARAQCVKAHAGICAGGRRKRRSLPQYRGQAMLMPPSLLDWVPEDHLVWTILGAVEEMDLSAFYGAYRANGQGRAAYEPSMMVALLLYAYARGNRSSRGIERACREDVVYKVITAMRVPDHSTIAEFRRRHERAISELFSAVLELCKEAGLVEVGMIAIDGTKIARTRRATPIAATRSRAEILKEAEETDRWEDELYGSDRGDELPEQLRTEEGRRQAFKAAKERLAAKAGRSEEPEVARFEVDAGQFTRVVGVAVWHREGRGAVGKARTGRQADRALETERLLETLDRLEENHQVEIQANAAYEAWWAARAAGGVPGQKLGMPPRPVTPRWCRRV